MIRSIGVARNASDAELKKANRRLAMKFDLDRNPDDAKAEEQFKEAKEAYEVLTDARKRAAYDQFGHAGVDLARAVAARAAGRISTTCSANLRRIFGGMRGGSQQSGVRRGADLRYNLELTLEEAVHGTSVKIRVPTLVGCKTCDGSGAAKGSGPVKRTTCGGVGQVRMQQGFFSLQQTCRVAAVAATSSKTPAKPVMAKAACRSTRPCR